MNSVITIFHSYSVTTEQACTAAEIKTHLHSTFAFRVDVKSVKEAQSQIDNLEQMWKWFSASFCNSIKTYLLFRDYLFKLTSAVGIDL